MSRNVRDNVVIDGKLYIPKSQQSTIGNNVYFKFIATCNMTFKGVTSKELCVRECLRGDNDIVDLLSIAGAIGITTFDSMKPSELKKNKSIIHKLIWDNVVFE
jgi:hypothetical protein